MKKEKNKYKNSLYFCVAISIFIHLMAIIYLNKHFLSFSMINKNFAFQVKHQKPKVFSKVIEEDILISKYDLKENKINTSEKKYKKLDHKKIDLKNKNKFLKEDLLQETEDIKTKHTYKPKLISAKKRITKAKATSVKSSYKIKYNDNDKKIIEELKQKVSKIKESKNKIAEKMYEFALHKYKEENISYIFDQISCNTLNSDIELPVRSYSVVFENQKKIINNLLTKSQLSKAYIFKKNRSSLFLPSIPYVPTLKELNTISCSEDFDIELEYIPKDNEKGYVFALTLLPKADRKFKKIKQNFYFLVDKSNSIQNKRYAMTRHAIISAISSINKEDTFNIIMFNNKVSILFDANQNPSHNTVSQAKRFLISQKLGSFLSTKSFALPLGKVLFNKKNKEEINHVIIISDGEGLEKSKNHHLIKHWTDINKGSQNLYTLALNSDKNLPVLELFSFLNNGKIIVANSIKGIRRHLTRLIKNLNNPVAKNISINIYEKNFANVVLHPLCSSQQNLYYDQPHVVIGSIKDPDDFIIFIQGKNPDRWFNIKKEISFDNAKLGGIALEKKWAQYRANKCYNRYLKDKRADHIKRAKDILAPYDLPPTF